MWLLVCRVMVFPPLPTQKIKKEKEKPKQENTRNPLRENESLYMKRRTWKALRFAQGVITGEGKYLTECMRQQ